MLHRILSAVEMCDHTVRALAVCVHVHEHLDRLEPVLDVSRVRLHLKMPNSNLHLI